MKISVMQPYYFPYIGYWELIRRSDVFIILDDVNFIKRGWVNRNRISNGVTSSWLTIPLVKASQNRPISAHRIVRDVDWHAAHRQLLQQALRRYPHLDEALSLYDATVDVSCGDLAAFLTNHIRACCRALRIATRIELASAAVPRVGLDATERIIALCVAAGGDEYINLSGGRDLYSSDEFERAGIALRFLDYDPSLGGAIAAELATPPASVLEVVAARGLDAVAAMLDDAC